MTKVKTSLKLNVIMNAVLSMSSLLFPLITFPYVSRILLPEGTGRVSFATSVISYFVMISQLGIPTYGIRACSKVRDNKTELTRTVHEILIINLITTIFAYVAFFITMSVVPRFQNDRKLFFIVSTTIFLNTLGVEWLYKALEQYTYITIRSICFKLAALVAMFILIHKQDDYIIYGGISIFAASASNILNFINLHKYISIKITKPYFLKYHIKAIVVFFAMSCATIIYTNLDTVMLGFIKSDAEVGYYNAAVKIKTILVSIVTSFGVVLLPRASYYLEHDLKNEFLKISKKAIHFVMIIAFPFIIYFVLFAEEGICFLSGTAYSGSIIPMKIIMPALLFIGLTNIMGIQMLLPMGKENIVLISEIAGAVVDLILNFLLIPYFGSKGTALGTLVAEIFVFLVQIIALKNIVLTLYRDIPYWKILIALVPGSILAVCIKGFYLSTFLTLLISFIIFFGLYIMLLIATKEPFADEMMQLIHLKISKDRKI